MSILPCTRLGCGRSFKVIEGRWEYGSYCSRYCSQHDASGQFLLAVGPDMESPDEFLGINAFRNKPTQMGAGDEKEPPQSIG